MVYYLIEIIFKDVEIARIAELLKYLTSSGKRIIDYTSSSDKGKIRVDWGSEKEIRKIFSEEKKIYLLINLDQFKKGDLILPRCEIIVYKKNNSLDLEINFEYKYLKNSKINKLSESLLNISKSIAQQYHISTYFCGLEPAQDLETRLFTNGKPGPLYFKDW